MSDRGQPTDEVAHVIDVGETSNHREEILDGRFFQGLLEHPAELVLDLAAGPVVVAGSLNRPRCERATTGEFDRHVGILGGGRVASIGQIQQPRELRRLLELDELRQRPGLGVRQVVLQDVLRSHLAVQEQAGDRPRQVELGLFGRLRQPCSQPIGVPVADDVDAGDLFHWDGTRAHEVRGRIQSRVVPAAAGVLLPLDPAGQQVGTADVLDPARVVIEAEDAGHAREPQGGEVGRHDARQRTESHAVLDHGRMVEIAHQGQVGGVVLGDSQGLGRLRRRETEQTSRGRRHGDRPPRAAGPVAAVLGADAARVHAAAGPECHFVADHRGRQQLTPRHVPFFRQGEGRGEDLGARVSAGVDAAVVDVGAVGGDRVGEGGAHRGNLRARPEHGRAVALQVLAGIGVRNLGDLRLRADQGRPERVEQTRDALRLDRGRKIGPRGRRDKVGNVVDRCHRSPRRQGRVRSQPPSSCGPARPERRGRTPPGHRPRARERSPPSLGSAHVRGRRAYVGR